MGIIEIVNKIHLLLKKLSKLYIDINVIKNNFKIFGGLIMKYIDAIKARRSHYNISRESTLTDNELQQLLKDALLYTPSSFNSHSGRTVLLLNEHHDKLWSIVMETLRKIVPADKFSATEEKINSFAAGYGTVLFFEDMAVVKNLQEKFPLYAENFTMWSNHSAGMLQYVVWTGLAQSGIGASLQHYNPLIDEEVKKTFNIPDSWKLIAQMPFGKPTDELEAKTDNIEEHLRVFK